MIIGGLICICISVLGYRVSRHLDMYISRSVLYYYDEAEIPIRYDRSRFKDPLYKETVVAYVDVERTGVE